MKYWKKFFTKRMNEWDEGKKISAVLKITGAILCIILGILGWSWILAQIVLYVMENHDWIIFTIIVGIIFICALKVWFPLEIHNAPPMPEKPLNSSQITQALITNYGLLCTALMDVLPKLQPILKIHIPNYDSELHSEKKFIRLGTIVLYEYIIYKTDNVSTEFFKAALSQEIEMNLNLGKIIGMSTFSNLRTLVYGIFKRPKKRKLISYSISEIVNDIEFSRNAFKRVIKEDYQEVFMEDEERLIHRYLTSNPDILNLGILLLFGTGPRVGELVTIMPQQDIEGNVIHVRRTETRYKDKHGKNIFDVKEMPKTDAGIRDVIVPKDYLWVLQKIEQLNPSGEYLLMKNGTRVRTYTIRKRLSKVCELTKVYKKSPHKIRKTYGTILLDNDVDTTLIISQMGHTNILCTEKHYPRNRKDIDKKALVLDSIPDFMAK